MWAKEIAIQDIITIIKIYPTSIILCRNICPKNCQNRATGVSSGSNEHLNKVLTAPAPLRLSKVEKVLESGGCRCQMNDWDDGLTSAVLISEPVCSTKL